MPTLTHSQTLYHDATQATDDFGWAKRLTDIVLCVLFSPFVVCAGLFIALVIKLDSRGPVIFTQWRAGQHGKPFRIYKFRSLYHDHCHATGGAQLTATDCRLTRVGRVLRGYSLDELPQIINILSGQMSLVGPRPHAVEHHTHYSSLIPHYNRRLTVLPGLTGLAQVNGWRGATRDLSQMQSRFYMDCVYINQQSWSTDIRILYLTLRRRAWRCPDM